MSLRKKSANKVVRWFIECDYHPDGETESGISYSDTATSPPAPDETEARRLARAAGWVRIGLKADACPTCAP